MSPLSVLFYTVQGEFWSSFSCEYANHAPGNTLRRAYGKRSSSDAAYLELFSRILVGHGKCPSTPQKLHCCLLLALNTADRMLGRLLATLEKGINLAWEDGYDFVNPFGDRRGNAFESVWTFDLDKDLIFLTKQDQHFSAPLGLAGVRLRIQNDFESVSPPKQSLPEDQTLPGPYWEPALDPIPRETSFLGRVLRDFAYTWRHIIRRDMNTTTFMKLAYAIIWISRNEFTLLERMGFEHVSQGGPYVRVIDLPSWDTPEAMLVPVGSSCFVLSQDIGEGLEMVRHHTASQPISGDSTAQIVTYAIFTLRHIVLCKAFGDKLVWTRPEGLFHDGPASDTAINWILSTASIERPPTKINFLPVEIQDRVLRHATSSLVASAKLGCELGLGSPFSWVDRGVSIGISESKRHRGEASPVESQLIFNGVKSGLSYKRERGYQTTHPGWKVLPPLPRK